MASKPKFFRFRHFTIKDGSKIRFWKDKWLGNTTPQEQYPALYNIVRHKGDFIVKVMATSPPDMSFRRDVIGQRLVAWETLLQCLALVRLVPGSDKFWWNLHTILNC
jgi:hypothetical protein